MDAAAGRQVYEWLSRVDIGTLAFGTGPFEGEALIVEPLGGAIRLQVTLSPRVETVDLLASGELHQTLPEVREGDDGQWPLVESGSVEGTVDRPFIRLWEPGIDKVGRPRKYVTLPYAGPRRFQVAT